MSMIRQTNLANGLVLTFRDESNRYFGDYHRVCVVATIRCPLDALQGTLEDNLYHRALKQYGTELCVEKRFERMGVASADVDVVRDALVDDFLRHAAQYLGRPEYPRLLVTAELNRLRARRRYV